VNGALAAATGWDARLDADGARARRNLNTEQRATTDELLRRGREAGIQALALTGSTARGSRTAISDLDYYVIGPRLGLDDLSGELDVVTDSEDGFFERLRRGDDFAQWTLRFGCVLLDPDGVMRRGAELVQREQLWPDAEDKLARVDALADLAEKVIRIGDREAGQEHVRAALTALARGLLLIEHVFPLARAELPAQLVVVGESVLGRALDRTIRRELGLEDLTYELSLIHGRRAARDSADRSKIREHGPEGRVRKPSD
jgi:hypothetical protein